MLFYSLCLDREQQLYAKSGNGHISRVKAYGKSSTTTLKDHLFTAHKVEEAPGQTEQKRVQSKLVFKQKLENFQPFTNQYELNRDLTVWACLDLSPFMFTEKAGMQFFFDKNHPNVHLPGRDTLARGGLYDVYGAVIDRIKQELAYVRDSSGAIGIMFDGWTDKYKRYPYLGLRVSYVDRNWSYRVVTVSLKVLEKHTGDRMSSHVREELRALGVDLQSFLIFTTHDGASNMMKASQLLRSVHTQHCVAHALHLLLVTDGISKVSELVELLDRCKAAVIKLDSKSYIVENEQAKTKDREVMDHLLEKIAEISRVLLADQTISVGIAASVTEAESEMQHETESTSTTTEHHSLKKSCITRWNSILTMVDSVLCLWTEMNEALKSNGDREYCLTEDDRIVLRELHKFLQPFAELTELVSSEQPHLGLIPLIIAEVKDVTKHIIGESPSITLLKEGVQQRLPYRIKVTEAVKIATLLDPSSKHVVAADMSPEDVTKLLVENTNQVIARAKAAANFTTSLPSASNTGSASSGSIVSTDELPRECPPSCEHQPSKKMKLLQKVSRTETGPSAGATSDHDRKLESEVNAYIHLQAEESEENPLVFWKKHEATFPNLSVLAKCYLTVSASSVPVESMFSTCGMILNSRRSSMAPYRANMITVIHDNYAKFFPTSRASAAERAESD